MNKIGGEKLLSIWWFLVLGIVGLGIVGGVFIFYSAGVDIREIEANVLSEEIINCLTGQGYVNDALFENDFDIFKECNFNKEIINSREFYFEVEILDNNGKNLTKEIKAGKSSFKADCGVTSGEEEKKIKAEKFLKCIQKEESVIYYKNNEKKIATLYILTASNQRGKKIAGI